MNNNTLSTCRVTVITIVYNGESEIENTILSVLNQNYDNLEYIIIDGKSTDHTLSIINNYGNRITKIISEPDKGIYDAMNKGIDFATGEWVNFMNCGDVFYSNNVITCLFEKIGNADIIYGDNMLKYKWGKIVLAPDKITNLNKYMTFGHQTAFVKKTILEKYKFNLNYKISADYDLFYKLFNSKYNFLYIPITVSIFSADDGVSTNNPLITYIEDAKVRGVYSSLFWKAKYFLYLIKFKIRYIILKIIPLKLVLKKRQVNILSNPLIREKIIY